MQLKNTKDHFGLIAIVFHWTMAFLIIAMLILGLYMTRIPVSLEKLKLYGWHKEWGVLILMLVIARLTWRFVNVRPSLSNIPRWEEWAARLMHAFFYILMFAMPITGWLITSAAGLPVSFFGWFVLPDLISPNEAQRVLFSKIHEWLSYAFILAIFMHTGAALKHYFINKDDILQRMIKP